VPDLTAPGYLPAPARAVLPFARAYAAAASRRYRVPLSDCWDETITALLRATLHFRPGAGRFHAYARTAIVRGLWRYCRRPQRLATLDLDDPAVQRDLTSPSAEELVVAADAVRRALLLREHAALATARDDYATAQRLDAAAAVADTTSRLPTAVHRR